jgi:hypothetical protein
MTQLLNKKIQPETNGVRRRQFISTALLGSVSAALVPSVAAAPVSSTFADATDILPAPADSLSLYMIYLDRLHSLILHPYFELVGCFAGEVKSRYQQLNDDVTELQRLVPQLRSGRETSTLKTTTDAGEAGADSIRNMANERFAIIGASLTLVSLSSERLNDYLAELETERGSVTLSPRAVELLRRIVREIRELNKPVEGLDKTSKALTKVDNDLGTKISEIRANLRSAIGELVTGDLSGAQQKKSPESIQTAIKGLEALDAYVTPERLRSYFADISDARCRDFTIAATSATPTKALRDLLTGTVKWIESGGQQGARSRVPVDDGGFARVSHHSVTSPFWFGRWSAARQVLNDLLPPASRTRTFMCLCLIGPILAGYEQAERVRLIYDQIPNIMPGGTSDKDNARRMQAAKLLANL